MTAPPNRRVLLVDDMASIHEDFAKLLTPRRDELSAAETILFGADPPPVAEGFSLSSAFQGEQALEMVRQARAERQPYAVAIVDMRMPPGWDGVETIEHLWTQDPCLQVIVCTAYSDVGWDEILTRFPHRDQLVILRKPFDPAAAYQLVLSMAVKWDIESALKRGA